MPAMYYNLDPFKPGVENIEVFQKGKLLVDLHNWCKLEKVRYEGDRLTLLFHTLHEYQIDPSIGKDARCQLFFQDCTISTLNFEGGLTDLGDFNGIRILENHDTPVCSRFVIDINDFLVTVNAGKVSFSLLEQTKANQDYVSMLSRATKILNKHDPVGLIAQGAPKNEYCTEAELIISKLNDQYNYLQVLWMVYHLFVKQFDFLTAGSVLGYVDIARELNELRLEGVTERKTITKRELLEVLRKYENGRLSLEEVSNWAFEHLASDDIDFENDFIREVVYFLDNYEINDATEKNIKNLIAELKKESDYQKGSEAEKSFWDKVYNRKSINESKRNSLYK